MLTMNFISYAQLAKDVEQFCKQLSKPDLIVGIPKSGLIPATMMAKYWNVELIPMENIKYQHKGKKIYLVDDSTVRGYTLHQVMTQFKDKCKYIVIYDSDTKKSHNLLPYISFKTLVGNRFFQWNLFNHKEVLDMSCIDIDGVLCRPPTSQENDDGPLYEKFLGEVELWNKPQYPVGYLVTARLSKYKDQTVKWLNKHGIEFKNLVMLNMKSKAERLSYPNIHSKFKSTIYVQTKSLLFIEDEPYQAYHIHELSGKPVICVGNWKLYNWRNENGRLKQQDK